MQDFAANTQVYACRASKASFHTRQADTSCRYTPVLPYSTALGDLCFSEAVTGDQLWYHTAPKTSQRIDVSVF